MEKKTIRELLPTLSQAARKLLLSPFKGDYSVSYPDRQQVDSDRDAENNKRTTPPDGEVIDLCCIWAIEFYTPSHLDALLTGVQRFGWKQEGIRSQRDIQEWIDNSGKLLPGVRGSWLNLGSVSSSDSPFIGPSGTNDMTRRQAHPDALPPDHITEISGGLTSITSSLSCVIMCFVLDDDYAKKLDTILKTDRQTEYKVTPHFRSVLYPERQKVGDVKQARHEIKATVTEWFSMNFPGLFSSGLLEGAMPTYEFVTLRDAEPFPSLKDSTSHFLRMLGLDFSDDVWTSKEIPGLKLSLQDWADRSPQYHSILSMKESSLSDEDLKEVWNRSGRHARILFVDDFLRERWLLQISALLFMLEGYGNHLRAIRDSAPLKPGSRGNSVTILDKLASNVSFSIDIDAVTSELQSFAEPESRVSLPLSTFEPIEPQWYPEGYTLAESLCSAIAKRASWIQKMDRSLRDHGMQYGALVGAMENVRLQGQIKFFTIALTALTIVLLSESPGVQNVLKKLYGWLQSLSLNFMTF
ncbi:MAG: hypothetical protein OXF86_13455 [Caldilineaceae bacterium]|nr:hypothetical protein [Caldilineaceae bacterium]